MNDELRQELQRAKVQAEENGWYGFDLDGTAAEWHGWSPTIGPPVPRIIAIMKELLAQGKQVKIFTARVAPRVQSEEMRLHQVKLVQDWCLEHVGVVLPVTNEKDFYMVRFYDDRATEVLENVGIPLREIPGVEECINNWAENRLKEIIRRTVPPGAVVTNGCARS